MRILLLYDDHISGDSLFRVPKPFLLDSEGLIYWGRQQDVPSYKLGHCGSGHALIVAQVEESAAASQITRNRQAFKHPHIILDETPNPTNGGPSA